MKEPINKAQTIRELTAKAKEAVRAAKANHTGNKREPSWRDITQTYLRIADSVIPAGTLPEIRKKVYSAIYPFGERSMHPYKVWNSEVKAHMAKHDPDARKKALAAEQARVDAKFRPPALSDAYFQNAADQPTTPATEKEA